jgi:hypothetical protein
MCGWLLYGAGVASGLLLGWRLQIRRDRQAQRWTGLF